MFPSKQLTDDQRILKGFNWRFTARPLNKDDVFRKVELLPETPKDEKATFKAESDAAKELK